MDDYEFDDEDLSPSKPYTAECRAEIDEINDEIAELFCEIDEMG